MHEGPEAVAFSVGIVLLDLVPAGQHQPDAFTADNQSGGLALPSGSRQ
jgi:hypothetical protein